MQEVSNLRIFVFASIVTIVCSVILGSVATGLKKIQLKNADVDMKSKVLVAIGEDVRGLSSDDMISYFSVQGYKGKRVKQVFFDGTGEVIELGEDEQKRLVPEKMVKRDLKRIGKYPIYLYYASMASERPDCYVMPVFGKGLWSICYGFLALDKDASSVKALVYYSHLETPGLGAEITDNQEWVEQFTKGKKIVGKKGELKPLKSSRLAQVRQSPEKYPYDYWHISGATFTVDGVNKMLEEFLAIYNNYLKKQRVN